MKFNTFRVYTFKEICVLEKHEAQQKYICTYIYDVSDGIWPGEI